jgi:hypothetical protein
MRARNRDDVAPGAGAEHGLRHGLVGIGERLGAVPDSVSEAVAAAADQDGEKAGRMVRRFAELPLDALVWTRDGENRFHLGRITGPWRYDTSADAVAVGIHHVRDALWLPRAFTEDEVPAAVAETFRRGGRNLQRTHDDDAERRTAELWAAHEDGD